MNGSEVYNPGKEEDEITLKTMRTHPSMALDGLSEWHPAQLGELISVIAEAKQRRYGLSHEDYDNGLLRALGLALEETPHHGDEDLDTFRENPFLLQELMQKINNIQKGEEKE